MPSSTLDLVRTPPVLVVLVPSAASPSMFLPFAVSTMFVLVLVAVVHVVVLAAVVVHVVVVVVVVFLTPCRRSLF